MNNNQQELFTELTASEGASVSGGAEFASLTSGASTATVNMWLYAKKPVQDDPVLYVGGKYIAGKWNTKKNAYAFSNLKVKFSSDTSVLLFDQDPGGVQNHDFLMAQNVSTADKGKAWKSKSAQGYTLYTRVI